MKKKLLALFMALAMVATTVAYMPATEAKKKVSCYGDYAYSVLNYIDDNLTQRRAGTEKEKETADFLTAKLKSFGYKVEIQEFEYTRSGKTYQSQNVIATKKGKSSKEIIVGSHYDSVGTNGVDDNGSGTVVNLETAKRLAKKKVPYTIKFVFFGAEEVGLKGSKAYAAAMTEKEIANTLYMVNMDSMLAGTYRYVYGGKYNKETGEVEKTWVVEQTKKLADALGTGMRLNNTELNYDYPSPSTGSWSDHASFWNILPYVYFEAANWEVLDDPAHPEWGSSGAYETEIGEVMHVADRDNLTFIEKTWGKRGRLTVGAYCKLLETVLYQVNPDGLLASSKAELEKALEKAATLTSKNFKKNDYRVFQKALAVAKKVQAKDYVLLKDQIIIDMATKGLNKAMAKAKLSIEDATVEVKKYGKKLDFVVKYDGKTLKKGRDYTIKYTTDRKLTKVTVTVKGVNKYTGELKTTLNLK